MSKTKPIPMPDPEPPEPPCCTHPRCLADSLPGRDFCAAHMPPDPVALQMQAALRRALGETLAATDWRNLPLAVQLRVAAEVSR